MAYDISTQEMRHYRVDKMAEIVVTGLPREEALRRAVAAGSAACLHYGTHAPSREEAEALLSRVGIDPAGNLPD